MIGSIPSYGDFAKEKGQVLGICQETDCGYQGPMEHGLTGYECARCHSMKLLLKLVDGRYWLQFTAQIVSLPEGASGAGAAVAGSPGKGPS
jgi:hypothetical protein